MNNFLTEFGFNETIKNEIIENNSIQMYESLLLNEYECIKILSFLRKIGIACIKELLINKTDLFLNTADTVINKFKNADKFIIDKINKDYTYFDNL